MHYVTVHIRLRETRGSAYAHLCVSCGGQAEQWAYQYNGNPELNWDGTVYSEDLSCYEPMCRSCHRRFDIEHDEHIRAGLAESGSRLGSLKGSMKANKTTRTCECGVVSTPGGMGSHHKATNHREATT